MSFQDDKFKQNRAGSMALSHQAKYPNFLYFFVCVFMFLYKCYAVVVFMFIILYFVYFVCYSDPLCLKQASSFLVRLHSRSSQSAKKLKCL